MYIRTWSQQRLTREFLAYFGQPNFSGDDMNILQVGRPAVSRYHKTNRLHPTGHGINHRTHDFPATWANIKLGGFMLLGSAGLPLTRYASDDLYVKLLNFY